MNYVCIHSKRWRFHITFPLWLLWSILSNSLKQTAVKCNAGGRQFGIIRNPTFLMTSQEINKQLRTVYVDIPAICDWLRQNRILCSPLRILLRINMHYFISYDSQKFELPKSLSRYFSLQIRENGTFNVFNSINRPLTKFEGWTVCFIMPK